MGEFVKKERIKRYIEIFLLAVAIIVFYKMFDSLGVLYKGVQLILSILLPFIVGGALAYFLYPLCKGVESLLLKTKNKKIIEKRLSLSVFITYFSFLFILIVLMTYLIPLTINNIIDFLSKAPQFYEELETFLSNVIKNEKILSWIEPLLEETQLPVDSFFNLDIFKYAQGAISTASTVFSWLMGLVICPYFLFERRNLMHIFDQVASIFIDDKKIQFIHVYALKIHRIFSDFIYGKAIDSLIIGIIALVGLSLLKIKFAFVLALIIMITNMIPYFGPFIGGIPVVIITFIIMSPIKAFWVALFIFALQQFDGLILGPAILGDSVGISPFWIIFAITLFGGLWGFVGMFIGVPLIVVIRMVIGDILAYKSAKELT